MFCWFFSWDLSGRPPPRLMYLISGSFFVRLFVISFAWDRKLLYWVRFCWVPGWKWRAIIFRFLFFASFNRLGI